MTGATLASAESKVMGLDAAVGRHVPDGSTIFVGGFGQCIPFAIAHEIIRQGRRNLTLCRSGADILFDLLIGAGAVRKVVFGYLGNPGIGLAHAFRRAAEAGAIEIEDWTNFAMVLRLQAGALGVPFLPAAILLAGDMPPPALNLRQVVCPYTGEVLAAIPALRPDVAIVHAQRADAEGNIQLWGLPGDTVEGARAAKTIIATVEEIVPRERVRADPTRTVIPGFRVAAVCPVPWGAHPSYVHSYYGRDDAAYYEYDRLARSDASLQAYLDEWVRGPAGWQGYLDKLGPERLARLRQTALPPLPATGARHGD
jgi:glutaconate CoA-transferase, subunit A